MSKAYARLAVLLATSGHSGVDRIMDHLLREFCTRSVLVDLLHIERHGPYIDPLPAGLRLVPLGTYHVNTSLWPLVRYLRRVRPAALLSDKHKVNRVALWAKRLAGVNTRIVMRTGTTVSADTAGCPAWERWLVRRSMHRLYQQADAVLVPSTGAAQDLEHYAQLPAGTVRAVPNPVVTPTMRVREQSAVDHPWLRDPAFPLILGVGELSGRKDFATLIEAYARLRAQRPCRLLILGEGRERGRLQARVAALGLEGEVSLPGFISNPYPYLAHADLFALSSRWEGFGNVLVEAMAVGTPVVSTDCPSGPREILSDGRYGRLVPVGDARAFAEALARTLDHPPPSKLLQAASQRYSLATSADAYLRALGWSDQG